MCCFRDAVFCYRKMCGFYFHITVNILNSNFSYVLFYPSNMFIGFFVFCTSSVWNYIAVELTSVGRLLGSKATEGWLSVWSSNSKKALWNSKPLC